MRGLNSLRKNPIILFTASRYVSYALLFIRGILIAKILGPYLFGIWGFLTLSLQYLSYTSFGIEYAVTVELATDTEEISKKFDRIASVAFTSILILGIIISLVGIFIYYADVNIIEKYSFSQYVVALGVITGLTHLQQVFANIYRVYKKLVKIAISELFTAVSLLIVAFLFEGVQLVNALLGAMIIAGLFSITIYLFRPPFRISLILDPQILRNLILVGLPLLIFNLKIKVIL